jgi:LPS-assembly protein
MYFRKLSIFALPALLLCVSLGAGQQTNPVDRQVANPITDTPNINPVSDPTRLQAPKNRIPGTTSDPNVGEVVVYSENQTAEGEDGKRIVSHVGNVDIRYGGYRLQADKVTIFEAENRMLAEGNVIFDQGNDQRITGSRADWNYKTKLGTFENSTGFTNQTNDGTVIYFEADRVERTSETEVVVTKGKFTACEDAVPKWSFTADEARIRQDDEVKLKNAKFKVKDVSILPLPYATIPIKRRDRKSGLLTPTFGFSPNKGFRLSGAYFQTLGRSADVTFRGDLYSSRGFGYGLDFRTRANSRSYFNFGFYAVQDRVLGHREDADHPDQGGSIVYAEGVHYFQNGFTAAADVRLTSNLAFRQVFSDGIQQIISPIEVSQVFINKSWSNYTLNLLGRSQVISIPNARIKTRNLPSVNFEKRPSMFSFLKPVYFSFDANAEGVSRREEVDDIGLYRRQTGSEPINTPEFNQRLDFYPQVSLPIYSKYLNVTATGAMRLTYYSNSLDPTRVVVGRDVLRKYGEFRLDVRPVALAKNYYGKADAFRFRHVIEPYVTYRLIKGVDNFGRIIRYDYNDTFTDTNEIEYGLINRIYTRRYAEAVTDEAQRRLRVGAVSGGFGQTQNVLGGPGNRERSSNSAEDVTSSGGNAAAATDPSKKNSLSVQPYEIFTLIVRGKYFFDRTFGEALTPGRRNQLEPITALSFYTFGGVPRGFSPLSVDMTYRPQRTVFFNTRMDVGVQGDAVRAASATVGYDTPLLKIFQTFYYTRAVDLIPSLQRSIPPQPDGTLINKEPGTLRGSQWSPSIFMGDRNHGVYGGASLFLDFENRRAAKQSPLISSLYTIGYAYDCCSLAVQYYTFNVGARRENRVVFSFRLNGIGTFGTEQFGQGLR